MIHLSDILEIGEKTEKLIIIKKYRFTNLNKKSAFFPLVANNKLLQRDCGESLVNYKQRYQCW